MANILLKPEDFSAVQWSEVGNTETIVGNEVVAPDGTMTGDLIVDDGSTGLGFVGVQQAAVMVATNTVHTYSVFAKPNGLDWFYADIPALGSVNCRTWFNVTTGAVGTAGSSVTATDIQEAPNGWYRCIITFDSDASDSSGTARFLLADGDNDGTSIDLDGTSSIYFWGAYLNEGDTADQYVAQSGWRFPASGFPIVGDLAQNVSRDIVTNLVS